MANKNRPESSQPLASATSEEVRHVARSILTVTGDDPSVCTCGGCEPVPPPPPPAPPKFNRAPYYPPYWPA